MMGHEKSKQELLTELHELRSSLEGLIKTESQYRYFIENIPQRVFYKDLNSVYVTVNANYAKDFGLAPSDFTGNSDFDFFPHDIAAINCAEETQIMETGEVVEADKSYYFAEAERTVHSVKAPVFDNSGKVIGIIGIFWDITERKRAEEKLRRLSERDPLTKIYNRRKLFELLQREIRKTQRYNRPLSLVMFDLDHFKTINDSYGHAIGDTVLKRTADIARAKIRAVDFFARYGGEEFVIACPETSLQGAAVLAEKIRNIIGQHEYPEIGRVTISAGVAEFTKEDTTGGSLVKKADAALYAAKRNGRNRVELADHTADS